MAQMQPVHVVQQSRLSSLAEDLMVLVMKDRVMQAGHVDLPDCLTRVVSMVSSSDKDNKLARVMVGMCRKVRNDYGGQFQDNIADMGFSPETGYGHFVSYAHDAFEGGVSNSKIVSLYVFSAELANLCMNDPARLGSEYVASVLSWHLRAFEGYVESWMSEHGGWNGFAGAFTHCVDVRDTSRPDPIFPSGEAQASPQMSSGHALQLIGVTAVTLALSYVLGN